MSKDVSKEKFIKLIQEHKAKTLGDELATQICEAIQEASIREKELHAIMRGSKAVLEQKGFAESARAIFDHCKDLIGATSGYVALLSDTGEENEVLFLEAGGLPCDVNPELPMPIRGLRAQAYHSNKSVYHNDFMNSEWVEFMPKGHVILKNVMFAPLLIEGKTVGIIGLANKPADFNDNDAKMATGFGELAAIALQNSRNLDDRNRAEKERDRLISKLQETETTLKKNEKYLTLNERRYKKAQKLGQVGNWEYDIRTKRFWGSDEAKQIYGFEAGSNDFSIDEVEKCIPDRKRVHQALVDLIGKGKPYDLEFEIRPVTGADKKNIKSIAEIVKDQSGKPSKVAGVIHDFTAQKLAYEELRKSEEKYRQLFNSINDYILVADIDRNIIDCNQALSDGFGYTPEEIIGKKTIQLYNSKKEYQEMGKALKKHLDDTRFTYNINYRKKSGEIFPGETNVFYLKNDKEEIVGFIGVIRDITYRKMVEEYLQMANDELEQKTTALEDVNTALKILLQKREQDNKELQENIFSNYEVMLTPFLKKLQNSASNDIQQNLIDIVDTNLNEIVSPFTTKLSDPMMNLTSTEIQISSMIKQGFSNKEIAQIITCSKRTIDSHRENIRRKLNLKNTKINLKTFLSNI
jgi:PAS domain S-box-containing protein